MAKIKKDIDGILKDLAQISEISDNLFESKTSVIFDIDLSTMKKLQSNFRDIDRGHNSFKIDISGTEFIFISSESLTDDTNKIS